MLLSTYPSKSEALIRWVSKGTASTAHFFSGQVGTGSNSQDLHGDDINSLWTSLSVAGLKCKRLHSTSPLSSDVDCESTVFPADERIVSILVENNSLRSVASCSGESHAGKSDCRSRWSNFNIGHRKQGLWIVIVVLHLFRVEIVLCCPQHGVYLQPLRTVHLTIHLQARLEPPALQRLSNPYRINRELFLLIASLFRAN